MQWPASTAVKKLRLVLDTFKGDAIPLVQDEWDFLTVIRCQREEQVLEVLKEVVNSGVFISGSEVMSLILTRFSQMTYYSSGK